MYYNWKQMSVSYEYFDSGYVNIYSLAIKMGTL